MHQSVVEMALISVKIITEARDEISGNLRQQIIELAAKED